MRQTTEQYEESSHSILSRETRKRQRDALSDGNGRVPAFVDLLLEELRIYPQVLRRSAKHEDADLHASNENIPKQGDNPRRSYLALEDEDVLLITAHLLRLDGVLDELLVTLRCHERRLK
jgi:hypothetical protein